MHHGITDNEMLALRRSKTDIRLLTMKILNQNITEGLTKLAGTLKFK